MSEPVYRSLAQTLHSLPNGFPPTETGVELRLLAKIFTPEEAALAHSHCLWNEDICADVLESGRAQVFHNGEDHSFDELNGVEPLRAG